MEPDPLLRAEQRSRALGTPISPALGMESEGLEEGMRGVGRHSSSLPQAGAAADQGGCLSQRAPPVANEGLWGKGQPQAQPGGRLPPKAQSLISGSLGGRQLSGSVPSPSLPDRCGWEGGLSAPLKSVPL